jgi:hypothetical protein
VSQSTSTDTGTWNPNKVGSEGLGGTGKGKQFIVWMLFQGDSTLDGPDCSGTFWSGPPNV